MAAILERHGRRHAALPFYIAHRPSESAHGTAHRHCLPDSICLSTSGQRLSSGGEH